MKRTEQTMSGEKQIEELTNIIWGCANAPMYKDTAESLARLVYNSGYCKQSEVAREIIFDLAKKLHTMLPYKIHPIPIDGRCVGDSFDLGKERTIYDILNHLAEIKKKYIGEQK